MMYRYIFKNAPGIVSLRTLHFVVHGIQQYHYFSPSDTPSAIRGEKEPCVSDEELRLNPNSITVGRVPF